jgi:hypothetical protein
LKLSEIRLGNQRVIGLWGLGLAGAILLDAHVVRSVFVATGCCSPETRPGEWRAASTICSPASTLRPAASSRTSHRTCRVGRPLMWHHARRSNPPPSRSDKPPGIERSDWQSRLVGLPPPPTVGCRVPERKEVTERTGDQTQDHRGSNGCARANSGNPQERVGASSSRPTEPYDLTVHLRYLTAVERIRR